MCSTNAQHYFLAHMDLRIGSGLAGVHGTGKVMEDVHFPEAGTGSGLTLIQSDFRHVPPVWTIDSAGTQERCPGGGLSGGEVPPQPRARCFTASADSCPGAEPAGIEPSDAREKAPV